MTGLRLGVHLGQQNLEMDELRSLWRRCDEVVDWISAWDHLYEAPPQGGTARASRTAGRRAGGPAVWRSGGPVTW